MAIKLGNILTSGATGAASSGAASGFNPYVMAGGAGINMISSILMDQADEANDERQAQLLRELAEKVKDPNFSPDNISTEQFQALQVTSPEIAQYIQETPPQVIREKEAQGAKIAQQKALEKYGQMAETGDDAMSRAATEKAQFDADAAIKSQRANLLSQLANRGVGGSGQEILAQTAGAQQQESQARQAALDAAGQAQQRRMQALGQYSNLAGQMRGEANQVERGNTDIINAFNERMTRNQNIHNQYQANQKNQFAQRKDQLAQQKAQMDYNEQTRKLNRADQNEMSKVSASAAKAGMAMPIQQARAASAYQADAALPQAVATLATQAPSQYINYKNMEANQQIAKNSGRPLPLTDEEKKSTAGAGGLNNK